MLRGTRKRRQGSIGFSFNFASACALPASSVFSRASGAYFFNSSGILTQAAIDIPRFEFVGGVCHGVLLEAGVTNYCRYNRDLTQASRWVATNITPLKNATGIDGVLNSCSTLTANSNDGTILQTIAGSTGSTTRRSWCWIKRVIGSGQVSMTQDNGATWTPLTLTSAWTKVYIPSATVANPVVGFKISVSGDSIEVDMVSHVPTGNPSSSIPTLGDVDVTRASDSLSINRIPWFNQTSGTIVVYYSLPFVASANSIYAFYDGTANERIVLSGGGNPQFNVIDNNVSQVSLSSGTYSADTIMKSAMSYKENDFAMVTGGGTVQTDTSGTVPTIDRLVFGNGGAGATSAARILGITYYGTRVSNDTLQRISV